MNHECSSSGLPADLAYMVEYASRWKGPKFAERVLSGEFFARYEIPPAHAWTMPLLRAMAQPMPEALRSLETALDAAPPTSVRFAIWTFVTERMEEFLSPPFPAEFAMGVAHLAARESASGFDPVVGAILLSAMSWSGDTGSIEAMLIRMIERAEATRPLTEAAHAIGDMIYVLAKQTPASAFRGMATAHQKLQPIVAELQRSSAPIAESESAEARDQALNAIRVFVERMQ